MTDIMSVTYHAEYWEFTDPAPEEIELSLELVIASQKKKNRMVQIKNDGYIVFNDVRGSIDYQITGWKHPHLVATLKGDYRRKA